MFDLPGIFPNQKHGAISFTYDGALDRHLDEVMPQLESFGIRGTFYVPTRAPGATSFRTRPDDWKAAFARGHEIGNATQYHPCARSHRGVKPNFSLEAYSLARLEPELLGAIADITEATGSRGPQSFAYPCGEYWVGPQRTNYRSMIARLFPAARGLQDDVVSIDPRDYRREYLPAWRVTEHVQMQHVRRAIDDAVNAGRWMILSLHVSATAHVAIIDHVAQSTAHVDTVISIARHLQSPS